jgi:hypothetical protein
MVAEGATTIPWTPSRGNGSVSDHVQPLIDGQAALVSQLTGQSAKLTPEQLAQVRNDVGGIASEYQRASSAADKNSPAYKQKGLDSLDNYTQYWYDQMRNPSDYTLQSAKPADPQQQATDLVTNLTKGFTDALSQAQGQTTSLIAQMQQQQTALQNTMAQQTMDYQKSQGDLLAGFQKAQEAQAKQMADLVAQLNSTAQPQKTPNYSAALAKNKALNSGGLSSTMLTGATGVNTQALTLGKTSLLGA